MARTPTPIRRRLPGDPRPAEDVLREYEQHRQKLLLGTKSALVPFFYPDPEKVFRWRIELYCGCIQERLTGGDKPESITGGSDADRLSNEWLPPAQYMCDGKHRRRPRPIRGIIDWGERTEKEFAADPVEPPDWMDVDPDLWAKMRHAEPHKSASWKAKLECGHFASVPTDVDWKPEDGLSHPSPERLEEMRAESADLSRYYKRPLAAGWPRPAPFRECDMCPRVRTLVAYEPVGWLKAQPRPVKAPNPPKPPSRRSLQMRLRKLEVEAEQLRKQLENRPE